MRQIGVVTVGRSDYGIYLPILRAIEDDPDLDLALFVSGSHLLPEFGHTIDGIVADGFRVAARIPMLSPSDAPEDIAQSMGRGVSGFGSALAQSRPAMLLVLGDRFEMHAAALAALPFKVPVAHIHGGEETVGAFDNSLRHSISKLSHLHFPATEQYARRLRQMGEEPWRITVAGAPSLDNLKTFRALSEMDLKDRFAIVIRPSFLLVTFHPVTLEYEQAEWQANELLTALEAVGMPVIFTMPNPDTHGRLIRKLILQAVAVHTDWQSVENLGTQGYFSLMARAAAMVGNSSSGIIEAASFKLPVVNIGNRQYGRLCPENVISVDYGRDEVIRGIRMATDPEFRQRIAGIHNPYGDGRAAERIVERLKNVELGARLIRKPFYDLPVGCEDQR